MQKVKKIFVASVVYSIFCSAVLFSPQVFAEDAPAAAAEQNVPQKDIREMQSQFSLPKGIGAAGQKRMLPKRMEKVLSLGQTAEKKYPDAKNLYEVREVMLHAAGYLVSQKKGNVTEEYYQEIAKSILNSDTSVKNKVSTEFALLFREAFTKKLTATQIDKKLDVLLEKYKKTKGYPHVVCNAVILGYQTKNQKLADKYVKILKKDCPDDPEAKKLLKAIKGMNGNDAIVGKTFMAELETIDGKKFSMPKDTKGKIVVVDFWASWCPPCRRSIPHLKKFHAKYSKQGVVVIGISLDKNKAAAKQYIKSAGIPWVIAYSGKGWGDPTAKKYGIRGIPSVWVIGKDGKIVSTDAAGHEDQIVSVLLNAKEKAANK